jgi:hypothetical protein
MEELLLPARVMPALFGSTLFQHRLSFSRAAVVRQGCVIKKKEKRKK